MEVMDLSMRKHHNPVPTYLHQNPYMMANLPMYSYPPNTLVPTTVNSSIGHLGLFQQLHQYAAAAAAAAQPQMAPMEFALPTQLQMLPQPESVMRQPQNVVQVHHPQTVVSEPQAAIEQCPRSPATIQQTTQAPVYKVPQLPPLKRPFKTMASSKTVTMTLVSALKPSLDDEDYEEYRKKVMARVQEEPAVHRNMRRNVPANPEKCNDPEYIEKRRKNNEAAKKSREARKTKEDELAIRVAYLEKENLKMKFHLAAIEREKKMIMLRQTQMSNR